jgi:recombination protein RecA
LKTSTAALSRLEVLESALRTRKLDGTLTSALAPLERADPSALIPTDVAALDACLRGGLPRGQLSELAGPQSSGRTTTLLRMLAAATQRGEIVAVVDAFDRLDVQSAVDAGVDLSRLLWVRGHEIRGLGGEGARGQFRPAEGEERSVKALNLVLQAGGFGIVVLDLADASASDIRRLPYTTWLRIQRTIEGSDTACVLVGPEPIGRSAGGLTLTFTGRSMWAGNSDRSRRLTGAESRVQIHSPRRRVEGVAHVASMALAR